MQHRRFRRKDNYGVNEYLNDLDKYGKGVQVQSTYYMQLTDVKNETSTNSSQRALQRKIDQPMLVYYSFNYTLFSNDTPEVDPEDPKPIIMKKALPQADLKVISDIHNLMQNSSNVSAPDFGDLEIPNKLYKESKTLKTLVYAQGLNQLVLRVSNLEDRFDGPAAKIQSFDVNAWAREFYAEANYHLNASESIFKDLKINITEMNLGASVQLDSLKNGTLNLTQWKTDPLLDPVNVPKKPVDYLEMISLPQSALGQLKEVKEQNWLVNLEPQRIRVFKVEFIKGAAAAGAAPATGALITAKT